MNHYFYNMEPLTQTKTLFIGFYLPEHETYYPYKVLLNYLFMIIETKDDDHTLLDIQLPEFLSKKEQKSYKAYFTDLFYHRGVNYYHFPN